MKTIKKQGKNGGVAMSAIITALGAVEQKLSSITTLNRKQRRTLRGRERVAPLELILLVLQEAEKNGGMIAGIAIDVPAARAALAAAGESQAAADSARRIADRMEDDAAQRRIVVADRAFAIYTALRRLVHTPEGESLARTYEEMSSTVRKNAKRARGKKSAPAGAPDQAPPKTNPPPPPPPSTDPPGPPNAPPQA